MGNHTPCAPHTRHTHAPAPTPHFRDPKLIQGTRKTQIFSISCHCRQLQIPFAQVEIKAANSQQGRGKEKQGMGGKQGEGMGW